MTQCDRDTTSHDPWGLCYRQRANLRHEAVAGELLLLDEDNGQVHQLNAAASFVWLQCDGERTARDVLDQLIKHYDVDENVARHDVLTVMSRMCELDLLEIVHNE